MNAHVFCAAFPKKVNQSKKKYAKQLFFVNFLVGFVKMRQPKSKTRSNKFFFGWDL